MEIDGKIVDLAYEYFGLSDAVSVYVEDGRAFVDRARRQYDVIMVDAYRDITVPFQMSTAEFFMAVRERLAPGGVMVMNMNMRTDREGGINDYLCGTVRSVFDYVYTVDTGGSNRELFASADTDPREALAAHLPGAPEGVRGFLNRNVLPSLHPVFPGRWKPC